MNRTLHLFLLAVLGMPWVAGSTTDSLGHRGKKWLSLSSGITVSAQYYQNWGAQPRQQPFMYSISGAPALDIKGVTMPFQVLYSNQVFSYQQPFNQFGIAPRFKLGTVYLGTSSVRFSNYTLAGQRFTGAGADLQLGWLRLGGMYGRLKRAVLPLGNFNDPSTFLNEQDAPAFRRNGYTVKLGFGKKDNFWDFIWFRAWDVVPNGSDVSLYTYAPRENVVFGVHSQFNFAKKLQWKNDWAVSAFTRNTGSDSLQIDDAKLRNWAMKIMLPRISTQIRIAGESSLRYLHKRISPSFSYKRIEYDFTSLGAYYFLTDVQQFTGGLNLNFFRNRLNMGLNFGRQNDNLQHQRLRTSYRNIGSVNVNFNPKPEWGIAMNYSNFGITQSPLPKALNDTSRINQVNNSFSLVPRFMMQRPRGMHSLNLILGYNALSNLGASLGASAATTSYNTSLNYNYQFSPWMLQCGLGPSLIQTATTLGTFRATGASINAGKTFRKGQWVANYTLGYFSNTFNDIKNGSTTSHLLSLSANVPRWPVLSLALQHLNNQSNNLLAAPTFRELYINMSVSYSF
jgi:hypothetical protein